MARSPIPNPPAAPPNPPGPPPNRDGVPPNRHGPAWPGHLCRRAAAIVASADRATPVNPTTAILAALLALTLITTAHAQTPAQTRATSDQLLDALKTAPDEQRAAMLEDKLEQTWLRAGTPAVTLLMSRGLRSLQAGQADEAVNSFSDAITLQPDVAEAWHQRALARYHAGDLNGAIHDLEETVRLEPRDFAAFRTLADISTAREDWKGAYAAWQKVMELDPKTQGGEERLRMLKRKAVGEDT